MSQQLACSFSFLSFYCWPHLFLASITNGITDNAITTFLPWWNDFLRNGQQIVSRQYPKLYCACQSRLLVRSCLGACTGGTSRADYRHFRLSLPGRKPRRSRCEKQLPFDRICGRSCLPGHAKVIQDSSCQPLRRPPSFRTFSAYLMATRSDCACAQKRDTI